MKKIVFLLAFFYVSHTLFSQNTSAIGIRIGGSDGVSAEISFQNFIGGPNRIEADLGFIDADGFDGFKATLMYHWVNSIDSYFNWYIGVGGSIGTWSGDGGNPVSDNKHDNGLFVDGNGQIGIEYNFEIPLQISLDARPEIGIINDDFDFGYGLGIRYTF